MKRKIFIVSMILFIIIESIMIPSVFAVETTNGTCGENATWTLDENGVLTIQGSGSIESGGWNKDSITKVVIGNGITEIGRRTFYNCSNITDLEIGNNVTNIGEYAFFGCINLKNIIIPDSVTNIGAYAFNLGSNVELESVKLSKNIREIGSTAFYCKTLGMTVYNGTIDEWASINFYGPQANPIYYSHNLYNENGEITSVKLNSTITISNAFYNWSNLESIELAEGTTEISSSAFKNCKGLESITIPDSVNLIGESAFSSCTSLKSIILPNDLTIIPSHLFYNCTSLETITIPENITEISRYSFYGCSSLKEIVFNDNNLSKIGEYAFAGSGIENITIPDCTTVESGIFSNCKSLKNVTLPENLNKISRYMFSGSGLDYFVVPNTVTEIADYAFSDCTSLKFIAIAPSVQSIGEDSFDFCGEYIDLGNGMTQYVNKSFIIKGERGSYAETYVNSKSWKYTFEEHYNCLKSEIEPTCLAEGTKTYECLYCKQLTCEAIDKADHTWSDTYTIDRESTCTEKGEKSIHCTVCGVKKENSEIELDLKEHTWDDGNIIKNPTNTEKGIREYDCIYCDATKQEEIDILKYSISGEIESFLNEENAINIKLVKNDNSEKIYENDITGNNVSYSINEIPAGTYKLYIEKMNHISKEYSITIDNESIVLNVKICPLGDINEDGKINVKDWNRLYEHIMGIQNFSDEELVRADINKDGKANVKDWNRMYEHIMGINFIC